MSAQTQTKGQNYIGGRWVDPGRERIPDVNPATGEVLAEFPAGTSEDAQAAVEAAYAARRDWAAMSMVKRGDILFKAAALLEQRLEDVARAETEEEGKTIAESRGEVGRGVAILRYFAGEGSQPIGDVYPSANATTFLYTQREPLGVVALITPWNFPVAIPLWKMAPALIYGNTVVFKPSELTPLTAWHIVDVLVQAGLPAGVLNMVVGTGQAVGQALVENPQVKAISFTGSNRVGRDIAQRAVARGAKFQLEMGGKNPVVVLADADMQQAIEGVVAGAMRSTGQKCTATSRVIVEAPAADEFADRLVERVQSITIGNPIEPATWMGPSVSEAQQRKVLEYIDIGRQEGAALAYGGSTMQEGQYARGHFVQPTVFTNVRPDMRIAQEEIFGPVVGVIRAANFNEAIDMANSIEFGLSASIFTRDLRRALDFTRRIEAGIVHVNSETAGAEPHVPFGGMKQSSSHSREQGKAAKEFFTATKTVYMDLPPE